MRLRSIYGLLAVLSLPLAYAWQACAIPPESPVLFPISFYQRVVGEMDGRSCPSYPVCSVYARQALERHGLLIGSWLILDRLLHEADDLQQGRWVVVAGSKRLYDPLARNDFWLR